MILCDVNVLVRAFRRDMADHEPCRDWLQDVVDADAAYGVSDLVSSGFLRVVTHPRTFAHPSSTDTALRFVEELRGRPNATSINPGPRHWSIFAELCRTTGARGNLVPDAYLAALAIESGSEWISFDRDFARFPALRWRHPFEG